MCYVEVSVSCISVFFLNYHLIVRTEFSEVLSLFKLNNIYLIDVIHMNICFWELRVACLSKTLTCALFDWLLYNRSPSATLMKAELGIISIINVYTLSNLLICYWCLILSSVQALSLLVFQILELCGALFLLSRTMKPEHDLVNFFKANKLPKERNWLLASALGFGVLTLLIVLTSLAADRLFGAKVGLMKSSPFSFPPFSLLLLIFLRSDVLHWH